jgi:DNA uptake protein ComE-like DNA-binding protein
MGEQNATPRKYAVIYTADGEDLAEILVKAGLARAFGESADFPDAGGAARFEKELKESEEGAKRGGLGIYRESADAKKDRNRHALKPLKPQSEDVSKPPHKAEALVQNKEVAKAEVGKPAVQEPTKMQEPSETKAVAPAQEPAKPVIVDINSASKAELMALPGIGEAFADRIIAARPFKSKEDVTRVKGIGEGRYTAIKGLIEAR